MGIISALPPRSRRASSVTRRTRWTYSWANPRRAQARPRRRWLGERSRDDPVTGLKLWAGQQCHPQCRPRQARGAPSDHPYAQTTLGLTSWESRHLMAKQSSAGGSVGYPRQVGCSPEAEDTSASHVCAGAYAYHERIVANTRARFGSIDGSAVRGSYTMTTSAGS